MEVGIIGSGYAGLYSLDNEYLRPETFIISERFKETANSIIEFSKEFRSLDKFGTSKNNKAAALRFKSRHKKKR